MRNAFLLRFAAASVIVLSAAAHAGEIGQAARSALRAEKALDKKKLPMAVSEAEAAVAAAPRDAGYRMLLGRAYLESGRFRSAATSFADALELDPGRTGAALNLALTRIGMGDRDGARRVIETQGNAIPPSDRGLALALAGDVPAGVLVLEAAVRAGGADSKTRQNLALAYALAGRWAEARLMASYDLDPQILTQRIMEWSRFTQEGQGSAQVAALLGVTPGDDQGQPVRLALHIPSAAPVQTAEAAAPPPPVMMAEVPGVQVIAAEAQALAVADAVQFAPRSEVVQAIAGPVRPVISAKPAVASVQPRLRPAAFAQPSGGRFVVQIGAYGSMGFAEDGWAKAVRRVDALRGYTPSTAVFVKGSATFYRLSVAGFATRASAVSFCETLRARGGQCFVREQAGDAPLQWAGRSSLRLAAR